MSSPRPRSVSDDASRQTPSSRTEISSRPSIDARPRSRCRCRRTRSHARQRSQRPPRRRGRHLARRPPPRRCPRATRAAAREDPRARVGAAGNEWLNIGHRGHAVKRQNANVVLLGLPSDEGVTDLVREARISGRPPPRGLRQPLQPGVDARGAALDEPVRVEHECLALVELVVRPGTLLRRESSRAAPSGRPTGIASARPARRRGAADGRRRRSARRRSRGRARRRRASRSRPTARSRRTRRGARAARRGSTTARARSRRRGAGPSRPPPRGRVRRRRRRRARSRRSRDGMRRTSRLRPRATADPGRYAEATTTCSKVGNAPPSNPSCRVWDTSRSRS